jgi:hypothetical protein
VLSWFHRMKTEPKLLEEVIRDQNSDEDENTVAQIKIATTKTNKKGKPESRCSSGIGTASHSSRMRDGPDDMSSRRSSLSKKRESFCEIR